MSQKCLRWYVHVARSSDWINQCREIEVEGPSRRGRYKTWKGTVKAELRVKLMFLIRKFGGNMSQKFVGHAPSLYHGDFSNVFIFVCMMRLVIANPHP